MKMKLLRVAVLAVTWRSERLLPLGAQFSRIRQGSYESSNRARRFRSSADLSPRFRNNDNSSSISSRSGMRGRRRAACSSGAAGRGREPHLWPLADCAPETVTAKVMRDGDIRWVHTQVPAQQLWPVVQDFWASVGLVDQESGSEDRLHRNGMGWKTSARLPAGHHPRDAR